MTDELKKMVEYLTARYDEDEAVARAALFVPDSDEFNWSDVDYNSVAAGAHGVRWTPEAVLADLASKRAALAMAEEIESMAESISGEWGSWPDADGEMLLKALLQPFSVRDDFPESWMSE